MYLKPSPMKAIAWMIGALLSFTLMAVSVRELSGNMHAFQMLFIRSALGILVLAAVQSFIGWHRLRTARLGGHVLRNIIHFAGQVLWILGISLLPLAMVSAMEFTTPIWGGILAVLFLGERMNRGRWTAFALGLVGIVIILRPGFEVIDPGVLIMLACTFCFGATNIVTKWLTRSDPALTILFYMVLMHTGFGAVASIFVWTPLQLGHWPWLVVLAVTGLSAHYSLVRALGAADATFIMPFEFLRLPLVALVGFLLYAEAFEAATLLGAAVIFCGNYYSLRTERRS